MAEDKKRAASDPGLSLVQDLLPPHCVEAEQAVLAILIGGAKLADLERYKLVCMEICNQLESNDFYRGPHQYIYEVIQLLVEAGEPLDIITISENMLDYGVLDASGGRPYLMDLCMSIATLENYQWYVDRIRNEAIRRQILFAGNEIAAMSHEFLESEKLLQDAQNRIMKIAERQYKRTSLHSAGSIAERVVQRVERSRDNKEPLHGLMTGWSELDNMLLGWHKGDLIIVAARPSMGKTAFVLNSAASITMDYNKPVIFFSMEMSEDQLMQRLIAQVADIDAFELRLGVNLGDEEFKRIKRAEKLIKEAPLYIDDTADMTPMQMRIKINQMKMKIGDIGLVVVDYLQLMQMDGFRGGDNRTGEVSAISRALKKIARECGVPIIALSQLSRNCEARDDKRPLASDLRESGAIEQDADLIIMLYRDDYYNEKSKKPGVAELLIRKHRNGQIGTIELQWSSKRTQFIGRKGVVMRCYAD